MKKVFVVFVVLILLVVATLVVLPFLLKDDIVKYIKNDTINGRIEFNEDINIGLISTFPNLNVGIRDLKVINNAPFDGDTLLSLAEISITVDLMKIISGEIEVKSIALDQPRILVYVKEDGTANYDIALASEATESEEEAPAEEGDGSFSFKLSSLTINDGYIGYFDTSLVTYAVVDDLDFKMSGDFNEESMEIQTNTSIAKLTTEFEGVKYLNKVNLNYDAGFLLHLNDEKYEFKENALSLNEVGLELDGSLQFKQEDMLFDITYGLTKTEFKDILSLVPAVYLADFDGLKADGTIAFDGFMKGLMTETEYPSFELNLGIADGTFQYPDLPSKINNTSMKLAVTNPGGAFDNTVVNLSQFHLEMDQEPFDARLLLTHPDTDPEVDAELKGKVDLGRVANLIPLEGVTKLAGVINTEITAKGKMSVLEEERYDQFYCAGNMTINDFAYQDADLIGPVEIPAGSFSFTPEYAELSQLEIILDKSDLQFTGKVSNYLPYVFHDQTITGEMTMRGNVLDLNPWMADEEGSEEATTEEVESDDYEMEVVEVPGNINFVFDALIEEVLYESYDIKKFRGAITVKDQVLSFSDLGMDMLGGSMVMNGSYNTQNISTPVSDFSFDMTNVSIPGVYATFNTFKELMPIASQLEGSMNGKISLTTQLGGDMMPKLETVNGLAQLSIPKAVLAGNETWSKVVGYLGWDDSKKRLLITNIKPSFKIVNGEILLDTFDFDIAKQKFYFGGKSSLNETVDYALDTKVPVGAASKAAEGLLAQATKNKLNLDLADELKVRFKIVGPMDDPEFKPTVLAADGSSLKDQAKEKIEELKKEAKKEVVKQSKAELRKQAAKLKDEAAALRKQAAALKAKAAELSKKGEQLKAESNALKKDADAQKAKIEKEMSGLPKFAREKAMKPVNSLFDKANEKLDEANKYFDQAKRPEQEADKLLKKADELENDADAMLKED